MSDQTDTQHYKQLLESEMETLVGELQRIGRINPRNPNDWVAVAQDLHHARSADPNEQADDVEEYGEHVAIVDQLETRFNEVKAALDRIDEGSYGVCEVGGEQIEHDRLEANPAARTCKKHMG